MIQKPDPFFPCLQASTCPKQTYCKRRDSNDILVVSVVCIACPLTLTSSVSDMLTEHLKTDLTTSHSSGNCFLIYTLACDSNFYALVNGWYLPGWKLRLRPTTGFHPANMSLVTASGMDDFSDDDSDNDSAPAPVETKAGGANTGEDTPRTQSQKRWGACLWRFRLNMLF